MTAVLGYSNLADFAGIASSVASLLPPENLQTPHVAEIWRLSAGTGALIVDLGSEQAIGGIALMGLNGTAAMTKRIRVSNTDPTGVAGEVYDNSSGSGSEPALVDPRWRMLAHVIPTADVVGRYVRIGLADASLTNIEAGRLFIGPLWRPQYGFSFGWGWSRNHSLTTRRKSVGGQTWIDEGAAPRVLELAFDAIQQSEARDELLELDRVAGIARDVLLVTDTASAEPGRDSIWGLLETAEPLRHTARPLYSRTFRIEERL